MQRSAAVRRLRGGFTLLEAIVSAAISATLMTGSYIVLQSSYSAWQAHENDVEAMDNAHGLLRFCVRTLRQAEAVTTITAAGNTVGSITFITPTGATRAIVCDGLGTVNYLEYPGPTTTVLVNAVTGFSMTAFLADGVTATTDVSKIQCVKCTATVTMPRGGGTTRTVSTYAWVRSW